MVTTIEERTKAAVDTRTGLLTNSAYLLSPYADERPLGQAIELIVIHGISLPPGQFGTGDIAQFFCGKLDMCKHESYPGIATLRVSAHILIDRKGLVTQFVPFSKRAWHAGQSSFQGRSACNDFSVGIELEGTDQIPYEPEQYQSLANVIKALLVAYPTIPRDHIVGHEDIAPGRKTDPGPVFDWWYLQELLK